MPPEVSNSRPSGGGDARRLGPYRLLQELGRGAMGAVYLAQREGLKRRVALKVLLSVQPDHDLLARFRLEAAVASKLQHPGIVGVHDVGHDSGRPYLVMEYCPGEDLRALLKREGRLEPRAAAGLVAEIARAVGYAHRQGVLHRDLKPANVIMTEPSGAPRITDFGLARDRSLQRSLTRTGDVLGTPSYMAPEQLAGRKDVDPRADVYSLGVILYSCLTGRRPYQADSVYQLIELVCAGGCRFPKGLHDVPRALEVICLRAMAVDRDDRPADGDALADELEAFLARDEPLTAFKRGPGRPTLALGLALASALAIGGAWLGWRSAGATSPSESSTTGGPGPSPIASPELPGPSPIASHAVPSAESSPLSVAPEPTPAAHDADFLACERAILEVFAGARSLPEARARLGQLTEVLGADLPDDRRLAILRGFHELCGPHGDPLAEKRRWLQALEGSTPLPDVLAALSARLCYALGFERAASDALRGRTAGELPSDWAVHTTAENHLLTLPPVRDYALAERVLQGLLKRRQRSRPAPGALGLPDDGTVLVYHAVARAAQGQVDEAVRALEADGRRGALKAASILRRDPSIDPENYMKVSFALCERLAQLQGPDGRDPQKAPRWFLGLAEQLLSNGQAEYAALGFLRGARIAQRLGDPLTTRRLLERAETLDLDGAPDVRALVVRVLGRALLEIDPARAERLGREAAAPWPERTELRTPGERADAWLLVARACRLLENEAGALEALQAAEALRPLDRRELEQLQRRGG